MVEGNLISDIRKNLETKSNLELLEIWVTNDQDQWSEEGVGGLFITLEISTIYFVNAIRKRENYFRET